MIIRSLCLHNFMSYADVRLDLSTVSVACLCGSNGSGKSALLDAITWALWEKARASSDDMIRLGEKEMWIDLVFSYEDRVYRVRRSRQKRISKSGRRAASKGSLELMVLTNVDDERELVVAGAVAGTTGGASGAAPVGAMESSIAGSVSDSDLRWKSLTGGNMRDTQQSISDLLRMDYDTFVNSAYLRQGRADEFTTRLPSERKHVLSEILGLSYFDRMKEFCRERSRDLRGRVEGMSATLATFETSEEDLETATRELSDATDKLAVIRQSVEEHRKSAEELQKEVERLRLLESTLVSTRQRRTELRGDIASLAFQEGELAAKQKNLALLMDRSGDIEQKAAAFDDLKQRVERLDDLNLKASEAVEEKLKLQSELATIRSRLEIEKEQLGVNIENLEKSARELEHDSSDEERITEAYNEYKTMLDDEARLAIKQDTFTRLSERLNQLQSIITEARIKLESEIGQRELSLAELEDIVKVADSLAQEREALESETIELDRLEAEFELVEDKGLSVKSEIDRLESTLQELSRRQIECEEKIRELSEHDHSTICPLCSAPIVDRAKVIERYRVDIDALGRESDDVVRRKEEALEERVELRQRYLELKLERERRKDLERRIGRFNEKEKSVGRAVESLARVKEEIAERKTMLDRNSYSVIERESMVNVKAEILKLEFDPAVYSNLQSQIRAKRYVEGRYQQLKKDRLALAKVEAQLPPLRERRQALDSELASETYGLEVRDRIRVLRESIAEMGYDREEHGRLRQELTTLLPYSEQYGELLRAREELPRIQETMDGVIEQLRRKRETVEELDKQLVSAESEVGKLEEKDFALAEQSERLTRIRGEADDLSSQVAVLSTHKERLEHDINEFKRMSEEISRLRAEREDYVFLAEAFGKKGIQAIIIENAIPEIESEANRILSRLTDNKMHVALVTRQRTKSGSVAETLDILIGDEIGTRSYELYSGGEAFKVNFAIRIALSRLLARRAGARLETLIIDEGFGSQDDISRERLVSAIRSVQSDFAKILVITHISDVRDMFPTQIYVTKSGGVSRISLIS